MNENTFAFSNRQYKIYQERPDGPTIVEGQLFTKAGKWIPGLFNEISRIIRACRYPTTYNTMVDTDGYRIEFPFDAVIANSIYIDDVFEVIKYYEPIKEIVDDIYTMYSRKEFASIASIELSRQYINAQYEIIKDYKDNQLPEITKTFLDTYEHPLKASARGKGYQEDVRQIIYRLTNFNVIRSEMIPTEDDIAWLKDASNEFMKTIHNKIEQLERKVQK